jgi:hypothetical protein
MKKYFNLSALTVVLMTLCLGFSSCANEIVDDTDKNSLVGLWTLVSVTVDAENPTDPAAAAREKELHPLLSALVSSGSITYEFKADKTYVLTLWGGVSGTTGTWATEGNKLTVTEKSPTSWWGDDLDEDFSGETFSYIYTVKNGVLTLIEDRLDEVDGDTGLTYREEGFTKYIGTMTFK